MKTFKVLRNTRWLSFTVILVAALSSFWALTRAAPEPVTLDGAEAESQLREAALYDSLPEAVAAARYTVQGDAQKGVYEAVNEAQGFRAAFTAEGAQLLGADQIIYDPPTWDWQTIKRLPEMKRAPAWQTTLKFVGYGYGETLTAVKGESVSAKGSRVEISQTANQNTALTEWFDNRPAGLEQGWRINAPPAGSSNGQPLRLVLALDGDLTARAEADGSAVNLCDQTGAPVLRYAGLKVMDAKGRRLTARLRDAKQSLSLEIEDNGATYPLTVDPTFTQAKKLTAATGIAARSFGAAVAIDGNTALIGAPGEQTISGATVRLGAAYVFINNNGRWEQQARLEAADGSNFDTFGSAVAVQGDTAVVGSPGSRGPGGEVARGAVYIFIRNGATWTQQAKLTVPGDMAFTQLFGNNVSLDGNTIVTGASGEGFGQGAGYIFTRSGATWTQQARLTAEGGSFGTASVIRGDTAIIGAFSRGAAYVFTRSGTTWTQQTRLTAGDAPLANNFGRSLAYDGNTVLIGANTAPQGLSLNHGAAYVFTGSGANWTQQAKLIAPDGRPDDNFGFAVALNGDIAYIGARFADIEANTNQGAIYRFNRFGNNWSSPLRILAGFAGKAGDLFGAALASQGNVILAGASSESIGGNPAQGAVYSFPSTDSLPNGKLSVSAADPFQRFGESVSLSGDTVIVGVGSAPNQVNLNRGRAFVFVRGAGGWTLQATLFPNDSAVGDLFGLTVAIQGNTALVGAPRANALQGAAYIFIRNGTTWTQQAKLNALDTSNRLGLAVALANDTAIVGAPFNNNFQGAAYVFVRNGTNWSQQAKLLASDGQMNQEFGLSVALEGDTALIGQQLPTSTLSGAAYVFTRAGAAWTQQVKLRPAIPSDSDGFGAPVALNGGTALIGAAGANSAYVFTGSGANWSQQAILRANTQASFGRAVALSGNTALIGAVQELIVPTPGEAYVFVRNGTNWTQDSRLTAADGNTFAQFGSAVAVEGETLVIGAPGDAEATFNTGAAFIYRVLPAAGNTPPEIRSTGDVGLRQGSSGVISLAIVSDVDQSPDTLNITVTPETLNGMTLNNLQIDDSGLARGNLSVACTAPTTGNTTFTLRITDAQNASVTLGRLITAPLPNTPPVLAYQVPPINLFVGDATNVRPTLGPSDNGAFTISLQGVTPAFAGQVTVNPTSGQVNIANAAPAGDFTVTLRAADSCGANTDASFNFNVAPSQLNTTTTLTSSRNPSLVGQPVTFTANVAFPTGIPNGAVTFMLDGAAQPPVTLAGGQASFTVPNLSLGLHTVVADYAGNATFPPSSDRLVQSVIIPIPTAWTATGSTGAVNEEDFAIMEMDGPRLGVRATGVVNARYNVVAVEDANFEGADNRHLINVRFRDTDGAGTAARVQVTLYRHEIDLGSGTTALFTFDSNNFPATGNRDLTVQLTDCAAGTNFDLDFRRYVYWVEAVITRNDTAQQAGFSGAQISETETPCP